MFNINKHFFISISAMLAGFLCSVCFAVFGNSPVSAVSASITTANSITLDARPTGNGVTIDEESIGITTTCNLGYDLNVSTTTSPNLYLNGNNTNPISFTTVNGTSALDSSNNTNKWGYTLTNNATSSTVFSPLSTTASVLRTISGTTGTTNETFSIYYGVKVDNTVAPGSYSMGSNGTILYQLTMNPLCNVVDIAYDGNNADEGTMGAVGTGVIHTGVKDGDTVNLIASNFSRTGYGFAGWSTDPNAGTKLLDNNNTNNPVVYGPQETVTLPEGFVDNDTDNDGIVKLYAVWLQSQGNLQGWAGCANLDTATYDQTTGKLDLTKNSVTALTDQRDNDTYAVARLADGNCWMIENLRLESTNSDNSTGSLAQGYGGQFVGLATAEPAWANNITTANSLYSTDGAGSTINIGTSDASYRFPRYNNINTSSRASSPTTNGTAMYSYGSYYTWSAAIADTTAHTSNNTSVTNTSICPTGWHLPKGGSKSNEANNEFWSLVVTGINNGTNPANYGSNTTPYYTGTAEAGPVIDKLRSYPNNFVYSGYVGNGSVSGRGTYGSFWSSTAYSSGNAYNLHLDSSYVRPGTVYNYKYGGRTVRCVVPANLYSVHFDANTTDAVTGTMPDQSITADTATILRTNTFQRLATSSTAYRFVKWNTRADGAGVDYADGALVTNLAATGQIITLYAIWEQVTPLTTNFNANGLAFADSSTTNTAYYYNDCENKYLPVTRYSHTSNISNDGTQNGNYPNNANTNEIITINGASKLHIKLTYEGESTSYDWVSFWAGSHPDYTAAANYSTGIKWTGTGSTNGKYGGTTKTTLEGNIDGSTVTFAFKSDSGGVGGGYGYYAVITGLDSNNNLILEDHTTEVCSRSIVNGEYKTPIVDSLRTFYGWSENQSAASADYATSDDILNKLPGNNGETKTLYAIWRNNLTINYNANGGTGTTAGQTVAAGETIRLKSNSFTAPTNKQFRSWNTSPDGTGTSYSANTDFTAPANVAYNDSLTLYAIWDEIYYIAFNANGGSGTMTNQTVVRDTATAIKTSTFTRTGYVFYGWNTADDGSGTFYSDGQKVTNLTSTGNTITLYAVWIEGAYLDTGQNVNQKLKRLAGNSSATYTTQDNTITAIARSNTLPDGFTASTENTISDSTSPTPIYAWYDFTNTTIYYYSTATNILMNKNSSNLFREMRVLSNLSTISSWDTIKVTNMSSIFYQAGYNATTFTLDLSSWDTSSVMNMSNMFFYAGYSATTWSLGNLSSWDTSKVTNMGSMFPNAGYNATTWSLGDLSSWDTSSVTNMSNMFTSAGYSATTWSIGGLSSWDTSKVTSMTYMFFSAGYNATTWSLGDLSSWDTSSVTNMSYMFTSAGRSATTWSIGDLSSWDTSSVTNMSNMFTSAGRSATTWSIGDLSSWNTSSVTDTSYMFQQAGYMATTFTLDLSSWDTSSVTNMSYMFTSAGRSATTWSIGDLSSWNTSSVTNMSYMFNYAGYSATTWSIGDLSSWDTSKVENMRNMFTSTGYSATTWSIGDLSSWNTSSVTKMYQMFYYAGYSATTWSIGDLSSWNTSSVTDMSCMFSSAGYSATTWSIGDLSSWNTSSVTDMSSMFSSAGYNATTWSIGDLSSWNTSSVTDMSSMFSYAGYSATTWSIGDLSSWDTSSVTSMYQMFSNAGYSATTWSIGDLSSWNTSSVTDMSYMFQYAGYSATTFTLDLSSWNTASVTSMSNMFSSAGYSATTWSITIPKTNNGTASGPISNTTSNLYGKFTSVTATPPSGKSFTLAN